MKADDDDLVPMGDAVEQTGIPRMTLSRWLRAGKIRGERDPISGYWTVDITSIPATMRKNFLRHSATARAAERVLTAADELKACRQEITELRGVIREKDAIIATLVAKIT